MRNLLVMASLLLPFRQMAFGGRDLGAAFGDPPDATQGDAAQRDDVRDMREGAIGEDGKWLLRRAEAERLKRHAGEDKDRSPASFVEPVDMVDVLAAALRDALASF